MSVSSNHMKVQMVMQKLNSKNYMVWSIKMRAVLTQQGVVEAIDAPVVDDEGDEPVVHIVSRTVDAKAKSLLIMHIDDHLLLMVHNAASAREAWLKLEQTHRVKNAARITVLKREMSRLSLGETENLEKLQQKLLEYREELTAAGYPISNGELLQIAADALPSRFDSYLALLEHQMDADGMDLDDFFARLQLADSRMSSRTSRKQYSEENEAEANLSTSDMRSGRSRKPGSYATNGQLGNGGKVGEHQEGAAKDYSKCICHWCGKKGHIAQKCRDFLDEARKRAAARRQNTSNDTPAKSQSGKKHANFTDYDEGVAMNCALISECPQSDVSLMDSGASHHMFFNSEYLTDYKKLKGSSVNTANGAKVPVAGIGQAAAMNEHQSVIALRDVLHVPQLAHNLISLGKVLDKGNTLESKGRNLQILKNGRLIAEAKRVGALYEVGITLLKPAEQHDKQQSADHADTDSDEDTDTDAVAMAISDIPAAQLVPADAKTSEDKLGGAQLWHKRFGHLHFEALRNMQQRHLVDGMTFPIHDVNACKNLVCPVCVMAKRPRLPCNSIVPKATAPLQVVNSDLCQYETASIGGNRHMIGYLDSYTSYSIVDLLKIKSQTAVSVPATMTMAERNTDKKLILFKSDRGGEYMASTLQDWFKEQGIQHDPTPGYTSAWNGPAERLNRTLQDKARAGLYECKLPKALWGEAVLYLNTARNCSPASDQSITPYEKWHGKKPDVRRFRIFGCLAYIGIPKCKRKKLDPRYLPGAFVGFATNSPYSSYKVYMPDGRILLSKHVIFDENRKGWPLLHVDMPVSDYYLDLPDTDESEDLVTSTPVPLHTNPLSATPLQESGETGELSNPPPQLQPVVLQQPAGTQQQPRNADQESATLLRIVGPSAPTITTIQRPVPMAPQATSSRYPTRDRQAPDLPYQKFLANSVNHTEDTDTPTMQQAMNSSEAAEWLLAIEREWNSLTKLRVWKLVYLPEGANAIPCEWKLKKKRDSEGICNVLKARLVAGGHKQILGVDCHETASPTARGDTIKIAYALAASKGYVIHHVDIATAFLNATLSEDIYMCQPAGYDQEEPDKVCKLLKSLYGLKQAPREWYQELSNTLGALGFQVCPVDPACFKRYDPKGFVLFLVIIVDDLLIMSPKKNVVLQFKKEIQVKFEARDLGDIEFYNGCKITLEESGTVHMAQPAYAKSIIATAGQQTARVQSIPMEPGCKLYESTSALLSTEMYETFRKVLGKCMWLSTSTRPDITFAVNKIARFASKPTEDHYNALVHLVRYIKGTVDLGLRFKTGEFTALGYTDADYGSSDLQHRKSCTGTAVCFSHQWHSSYLAIQATSLYSTVYSRSRVHSCMLRYQRSTLG